MDDVPKFKNRSGGLCRIFRHLFDGHARGRDFVFPVPDKRFERTDFPQTVPPAKLF